MKRTMSKGLVERILRNMEARAARHAAFLKTVKLDGEPTGPECDPSIHEFEDE